jgi:hypothetical protein
VLYTKRHPDTDPDVIFLGFVYIKFHIKFHIKIHIKFHMKNSYEKSNNRELQAAISRQTTHQPCPINYNFQYTVADTIYQTLQINHSTKHHQDTNPDVFFFLEIFHI